MRKTKTIKEGFELAWIEGELNADIKEKISTFADRDLQIGTIKSAYVLRLVLLSLEVRNFVIFIEVNQWRDDQSFVRISFERSIE